MTEEHPFQIELLRKTKIELTSPDNKKKDSEKLKKKLKSIKKS